MASNRTFEIDGKWIVWAFVTAIVPPVGVIWLISKLRKKKDLSRNARQLRKMGLSVAVAGVAMGLLEMWEGWLPLTVGAGIFAASCALRKREKRYEAYRAMLNGRNAMFIVNLASMAQVPADQVEKDLRHMLEEDYFGPEAYLDMQSRRIVLCREGAEDYSGFQEAQAKGFGTAAPTPHQPEAIPVIHPTQKTAAPRPDTWKRPETQQRPNTWARPAEPAPEKQPEPQGKHFDNSEYDKILREIRVLNDRIADEPLSEKIDRIEEVTRRIFTLVEEKPEMLPQIRKLMSYYLPTTLKLLDSYALLEEQGIEGDNITASKKEIDRTMDLLVAGFEKQLDQLFSSQAIDISSDIAVLEGMMAQDGIADNKYVMRQGGK